MQIWITRHGQTDLNKQHLMQGITDEPLNDEGVHQAYMTRQLIGNVHFDAIYASPLSRAIETAEIIANVNRDQVITDPRLIEMNFGRFEYQRYLKLGPKMFFYWFFPDYLPTPKTVESMDEMVTRITAFLTDLESQPNHRVLISCHGAIMRILAGCLCKKRTHISGRLLPHSCEIRIFDQVNGKYQQVAYYK